MKVVRSPRKSKSVEVECRWCNALLEVEKTDMKERITDHRDGDYYRFKYPCCDKESIIAVGLLE